MAGTPGPDPSDFRRFPTTHWTLVGHAGNVLDDQQREALEELLADYWPAIKAHLVTHKRIDPNEADDLVQGFIKDRVLENNLLAVADRGRGRFRSLLVKALDNYVANEIRTRKAKKRQPDRATSLDADDQADCVTKTPLPCQQAEASWARDTLAEVLQRMRVECADMERNDLWEVLEGRIVAPILEGAEPVGYEQIVRTCGFRSTSQAQNALVTAKRMFCRLMRAVLLEHGTAESDVDAEIRDLEQCLAAY